MKKTRPDELLAVTSLRFLAAFYVFLFHIHINWPLSESGTALDQFLTNGAVGMSLFFVLSGFVLAYRYHDEALDIKEYFYSRFSRIYPVYALAALSTLPWLFRISGGSEDAVPLAAWQIGFVILSVALLIQAWMPHLFIYWNNGGSWSISTEAFFYSIFPFTHRMMSGATIQTLAAAAASIFIVMSAVSLSLWSFPNPHSFTIFYSVPIYRSAEFLLGSIAGIVFARGFRVSAAPAVLLLSITVTAAFLTVGPNLAWHFTAYNPLTVPLIILMLVSAGSLRSGIAHKFFTMRPIVYLGHISYSFYSFQALALFATAAFIPRAQPFSARNWALAAVVFVLLTIIAAVSYQFVEKNFRRHLQAKLTPTSAPPREKAAS